MTISELVKQTYTKNVVFIQNMLQYLTPGIVIRIATDEEIYGNGKVRQTTGWSSKAQRELCYSQYKTATETLEPNYRELILTDDAIISLKNYGSIKLKYFKVKEPLNSNSFDYREWTVKVNDLVFITEMQQTEKTLYNLIKVQRKKTVTVQNIILTSNENLVKDLKDSNEKTLTEQEKAYTDFRILEIPIKSTELAIKEEK